MGRRPWIEDRVLEEITDILSMDERDLDLMPRFWLTDVCSIARLSPIEAIQYAAAVRSAAGARRLELFELHREQRPIPRETTRA